MATLLAVNVGLPLFDRNQGNIARAGSVLSQSRFNLEAQLVQLRYFTGLTVDQVAQVLGISPATADRYWAYARAWLRVEVAGRDQAE